MLEEESLTRNEIGVEVSGFVSSIQRFSVHDGPGIRTLVFMQGCPLRCKWCCNPESQKAYPQICFIAIKCAAGNTCLAPCVQACPEGAISFNDENKIQIDWSRCRNCVNCAGVCLYGARTILVKRMTVDELLVEIELDRSFYRRSGGGVTIGGGEPLAQFEFTMETLRRCTDKFLHRAIETCGHVPWDYLKAAADYLDLMYYDIKHLDPEKHKELTGVSNDLILANARKVLAGGVPCEVIVRTEVIPGTNDSEENIAAIAEFVSLAGGKQMELLPYHALGSGKYRQLGIAYELTEIRPPSDEHMSKLRQIVASFGIKEMSGVY